MQSDQSAIQVRREKGPLRHAIARSIDKQIGNFEGRRTGGELREKIPQVQPGRKTCEVAAEKMRFGKDGTDKRQSFLKGDHATIDLNDSEFVANNEDALSSPSM